MAWTYFVNPTDSDLSGGTLFNKDLQANGTSGFQYLEFSVGSYATKYGHAYSKDDFPYSAQWDTGDFQFSARCYSRTGSDVYLSVAVARVNSGGVVQETSAYSSEWKIVTGETHDFTLEDVSWGSGSRSDRLCAIYKFRNSGSYSSNLSFYLTSGTYGLQVVGNIVAGWKKQSLSGQLRPAGIANKFWPKKVSGALSFAGNSIKKSFKIVQGALSFIGGLVKKIRFGWSFQGGLSFSGVGSGRLKTMHKAISGVVSFLGGTARKISLKRVITGVVSFLGGATRKISLKRAIAGVVSFLGLVNKPYLIYESGLSPVTVRIGESKSFSANVANSGNKDITLNVDSYIEFTDGVRVFHAHLSSPVSLPASSVKNLIFNSALVNTAFTFGFYDPIMFLTDGNTELYVSVSDQIKVTPGLAYGTITLTPVPSSIKANDQDTSVVTSGTLHDEYDNVVQDGDFITVSADKGSIITDDADPLEDGVQVEVSGGVISFIFKAGSQSGVATISADNAVYGGSAVGSTTVTLTESLISEARDLIRLGPKKYLTEDGVIYNSPLQTGYDDEGLENYGIANCCDRNPITVTASDVDGTNWEMIIDAEEMGYDRLQINACLLLNTNFRTCQIMAKTSNSDWGSPDFVSYLDATEYSGTVNDVDKSWIKIEDEDWVGGEYNGHFLRITSGTASGKTYKIKGNSFSIIRLDTSALISDGVVADDTFVIYHHKMQSVFEDAESYRFWRFLIPSQETPDGYYYWGEFDLQRLFNLDDNPSPAWDESGMEYVEDMEFGSGSKIVSKAGVIRWRRKWPLENASEFSEFLVRLCYQESLKNAEPFWVSVAPDISPFEFYLVVPTNNEISFTIQLIDENDEERSNGEIDLEILGY